jgi:hypothetical protein
VVRSIFLSAPEGRRSSVSAFRSIEEIRFVELDAVRTERAQKFGFEVFGLVMLSLPLDVRLQRILSRLADPAADLLQNAFSALTIPPM